MIRASIRFLFFIIGSILFFVIVHVVKPSLLNYLIAVLVGFVVGLLLFIIYNILFPIKKKQVTFNEKIEKRTPNLEERNKLNVRKDDLQRKHNNERHFQDTDKIYIDRR